MNLFVDKEYMIRCLKDTIKRNTDLLEVYKNMLDDYNIKTKHGIFKRETIADFFNKNPDIKLTIYSQIFQPTINKLENFKHKLKILINDNIELETISDKELLEITTLNMDVCKEDVFVHYDLLLGRYLWFVW